MQKSDDSLGIEETKGSTQVNFVCQTCFNPLKLDPSLYNLDAETRKELESGVVSCDLTSNIPEDLAPLSSLLDPQIVSKVILPAKTTGLNGSGFTLIGEAPPLANIDEVKEQYVNAKLFNIMSSNTDIDHPLCGECTDTLLNHLDDELQSK